MRVHFGVAMGTAAFVLVLAGPARAQQAPVDPQRAEARERFQRGVELIREARWVDAIAELEASRDLRATPPVLYNLGLAQRAVGRLRDAVRSFEQFLALTAASGASDLRTQAEGFVRELRAAVAQLDLRVEPAGASVRVDGDALASATTVLAVDPGRHIVAASAPGFESETRAVEVPRGATAVLALRLVPVGGAARLHVEANVAEASIRLDGLEVGFGTVDETVAPGRHTLEVRARNRSTFRREFQAVLGATTRVRAVLEDQRSVLASPWLWTGIGVVAAAAVAGVVIALSGPDEPYRGSWGLVAGAIRAPGAR